MERFKKKERSEEGVVLLFNDNKGEGIIRLKDGRRIKLSYKNLNKETMFFLFEGEKVRIYFNEHGKVVRIDRL